MSNQFGLNRDVSFGRAGSVPGVSYDAGLRAYMVGIYQLMGLGLAITGALAWAVAAFPAFGGLFYAVTDMGTMKPTGLGLIAIFAPLAFAFMFGFGIDRMSSSTARTLFIAYSALMGISLASILFIYTTESVARTFFITAATFTGVSLWAYTTKRDLTGFGHFMMMGLIGIIVASIVNIFLASSAMQFAISVLGVVIFTGLTAWDTQKLKEMYASHNGMEANQKLAVLGALSLYMDFVNLFLYLLRFFGDRRE